MSTDESTMHTARRRGELLARAALAFSLTCLAVLGVVLSHMADPAAMEDLPLVAVGAGCMAVGLGVHGMALNDLIDLRRDLALDPTRILASGSIGAGQAALIASGSLILAVLGSAMVGGQSIYVLVLLAGALLFHNAMARFIPAIGLLMPGLLVAGLSMLRGWPPAVGWLPWSVFTIAVAIALLVHVLANKRPRPSPRALIGLTIEWVVVSVLLLAIPMTGQGDLLVQWGLLWPGAAMLVLVVLLAQAVRSARSSLRAADRVVRTTGVWSGACAATWCMAVGAHGWALGFAGATIVALLMLMLLREVAGASSQLVDWQ
ncbi:MAG: hypothetical protein MK101_11035 [Phycisphaerales bacterium]|nr:hypothetical protein [Phycisphaerales bacterium]